MTLHWWMHWFWVTSVITLHAYTTSAAPQSEELQHITTDIDIEPRQSDRQGRAMYYTKTPITITTVPVPTPIQTNNNTNIDETHTDVNETHTNVNETHTNVNINETKTTITNITANVTEVHPPIVWTAVNASDNINTTESTPIAINNNTTEQNSTFPTKKRNLTRPDFVKDDINTDAAESRIVTEKPLSLETTFLQTRIPPNIESSRRIIEPDDGMDTGAIAGISFAALVLVALAGSTAFVLYRRRYLNKPQTLNDKCSNPDSSGYLDDSTIRDNSEEMYSLDNDSFLNSLEAMTIQNYWTDTVKHTKL